MKIGVLKETQKGEKRVSISPKIVKQLVDKKFEVLVEKNAGKSASFKDSDYSSSGAQIESRGVVFKESTIAGMFLLIPVLPSNPLPWTGL